MKSLFDRNIESILIRSTNWIGDAIMTTPAVRAIRLHFPRARITMLAKPWVAPVFAHSPRIDQVILFEDPGRHSGTAGKWRLAGELRQRRFDAAILLQNAIEAALIAAVANIPRRMGFATDGRGLLLTHRVWRRPAVRRLHQGRYYLEMLKGLGIPEHGRDLELTLDPADREWAVAFLRQSGIGADEPVVGLNPSATYGPAKQWRIERWAELGDRLARDRGARVLIFGGPADRDLGRSLSGLMTCKPLDVSGRTTLGQAMALIGACGLFVTNDSGLMHVAAALNRPLVAIFGSTDPVATGPLGVSSRVVRTDLPCSPCLKTHCPLGHTACMDSIGVDAVIAAAGDVL